MAAAAAGKSNNETDVMYSISVACGRRQRQTAAHLLGNHRTSGADSHPHRLSARSRDHDSEIMPRAPFTLTVYTARTSGSSFPRHGVRYKLDYQ